MPYSTLSIHHNIHLTKQQRYQLHGGSLIETIGVSVPYWRSDDLLFNPATEVFCRYRLKVDSDLPIQILTDGYEIVLPYRKGDELPKISNEEWLDLSMNQPYILEMMYDRYKQEFSSKVLLDIPDGGIASMAFREHSKIQIEEDEIKVIHFVSINRFEHLEESL